MKSKQVTVSAKIPKKLKQELEGKGIKMSDAIRRGLEKELRDANLKDLQLKLKDIDFSKVSEDQIVRDVRETREEH
jgi:hypothetical protein